METTDDAVNKTAEAVKILHSKMRAQIHSNESVSPTEIKEWKKSLASIYKSIAFVKRTAADERERSTRASAHCHYPRLTRPPIDQYIMCHRFEKLQ